MRVYPFILNRLSIVNNYRLWNNQLDKVLGAGGINSTKIVGNVYKITPLFAEYLNDCSISKLDYKPKYDINNYNLKKYL